VYLAAARSARGVRRVLPTTTNWALDLFPAENDAHQCLLVIFSEADDAIQPVDEHVLGLCCGYSKV
jgi:hypothetical protein